jgi:hypothetical protein
LRRYGTSSNGTDDKLLEDDDDDAHIILADNLKQLSLEPKEYRFFGKSSGAMLIQTAIELKNEYTGRGKGNVASQGGAMMTGTTGAAAAAAQATKPGILGLKRNEFWTSHPVSYMYLSSPLIE